MQLLIGCRVDTPRAMRHARRTQGDFGRQHTTFLVPAAEIGSWPHEADPGLSARLAVVEGGTHIGTACAGLGESGVSPSGRLSVSLPGAARQLSGPRYPLEPPG